MAIGCKHPEHAGVTSHVTPARSVRGRGFALILALAVTAVGAMIAASLMYRMRAEIAAASVTGHQERAWQAAMAGLQQTVDMLIQAGGDPAFLYDEPDYLGGQLVIDDGADRWYFTVYAPDDYDPGRVRHGVTDLAGLINVNHADAATLRAVPGMTEELVDALLDYIDEDDQPRPSGAEQEWYDQLPRPYVIRNGPLQTFDELLLVRGFNARILYGSDVNLNGILDAHETQGDMDRGLRAWLTVASSAPDVDLEGQPRIDLNGNREGIEELGLPDETIDFIARVRRAGHRFADPSELLEMTYEVDRRGQSRSPQGRGSTQGQGQTRETIRSNVGRDELPIVMDRLTATEGAPTQAGRRVGRINVNTAPLAVLASLPGLDDDLAQRIVDARSTLDPDTRTTIAWLFTDDLLTADQFRRVAPSLTAQGGPIRVQVIGYGLPSGRYRVLEAVVDIWQQPAQVTYLRELTRLGLPVSLEQDL